jgi:ABC-type phosphate transport system permease subunit
MRAWPRVAAFTFAMLPVATLGFMIVTLAMKGTPPIDNPSLVPVDQQVIGGGTITTLKPIGWGELLSTEFSTIFSDGRGSYGLLPGIWGSVLVVAVSMSIAFPIALAMAVYASEFALGWTGKALRLTLGVLGGIPPIVYALMAVVFVAPFIRPKFTADFTYSSPHPDKLGVGADAWPTDGVPWNAGAFPWDASGANNSLILAGVLLALLVIPFIAPLIEDAIHNVASEPKEASLALGATRWYTLRRITLPKALPGIIGAAGIGTLKVMGDVMIVYLVIGFESKLPSPLFDVLERTGPLTSTGAALVGGFNSPDACRGADCGVGYFTAMLLMFMAAAVIAATTLLQRYARRRFAG